MVWDLFFFFFGGESLIPSEFSVVCHSYRVRIGQGPTIIPKRSAVFDILYIIASSTRRVFTSDLQRAVIIHSYSHLSLALPLFAHMCYTALSWALCIPPSVLFHIPPGAEVKKSAELGASLPTSRLGAKPLLT